MCVRLACRARAARSANLTGTLQEPQRNLARNPWEPSGTPGNLDANVGRRVAPGRRCSDTPPTWSVGAWRRGHDRHRRGVGAAAQRLAWLISLLFAAPVADQARPGARPGCAGSRLGPTARVVRMFAWVLLIAAVRCRRILELGSASRSAGASELQTTWCAGRSRAALKRRARAGPRTACVLVRCGADQHTARFRAGDLPTAQYPPIQPNYAKTRTIPLGRVDRSNVCDGRSSSRPRSVDDPATS